MKKPRLAALAVLGLAMAAPPGGAQERVDLDALTRIRDEGFRHSEVMALASELMDGVGPRLTGSPNMKKANDWAQKKFTAWGLANAHQESWGPFGRGWELRGVRRCASFRRTGRSCSPCPRPGRRGPTAPCAPARCA